MLTDAVTLLLAIIGGYAFCLWLFAVLAVTDNPLKLPDDWRGI